MLRFRKGEGLPDGEGPETSKKGDGMVGGGRACKARAA